MQTRPLPETFEYKATVNKRTRLYLAGKHDLLTKEMQKTDPTREETKWVWYPKEHIQTWLDEMEALGGNGIRIYFGEKEIEQGDETNTIAQTVKAAGQLCLIMVLTKAGKENDSNVNIIYEDLSDFEEREALYKANKLQQTEQEMHFNFGSYSPPKTITEGDDFPNDLLT